MLLQIDPSQGTASLGSMLLDLFFSPDRPFAFGLNTVIVALTVLAVVLALAVRFRAVPRESRALSALARLSSPSRDDVQQAIAGSGSLLEARVQDLAAYKAQRHPVDPAALTGLTTSALRRQLAIPHGIGRSLIILGLFGTLWGLGLSVTELAQTLRLAGLNVESLTDAILATLGGMQFAFGTTVMGISGSLLTAVAVGAARREQDLVLRRMERVISTQLVPLYNTSEATLLTDAARSLDELQARLGEDLDRIVTQIGEHGTRLGSQLREEFDQIEAAFERRAHELIETTGRALRTTLEVIGEREEGEPSLAEYVRTVRSITDELDEAIRSTTELVPALEKRLMTVLSRHHLVLDETLGSHRDAAAEIAGRQVEAAEALVAATEEGRTQSVSLEETLGQLASSFEGAREAWQRTDEVVEKVGASCYEAIDHGLRAFVEEVRAERVDTTKERERVALALTQFEAVLSGHLDRMQDARQAEHHRAEEILVGVREAVRDGLADIGSDLQNQGSRVGEEVQQAIERMARELSELLPLRRDGRRQPGSGGGPAPQRGGPWPPPPPGSGGGSSSQ